LSISRRANRHRLSWASQTLVSSLARLRRQRFGRSALPRPRALVRPRAGHRKRSSRTDGKPNGNPYASDWTSWAVRDVERAASASKGQPQRPLPQANDALLFLCFLGLRLGVLKGAAGWCQRPLLGLVQVRHAATDVCQNRGQGQADEQGEHDERANTDHDPSPVGHRALFDSSDRESLRRLPRTRDRRRCRSVVGCDGPSELLRFDSDSKDPTPAFWVGP
jgi:hypothetical protein